MKISQTRLDERTRRLCVEVCFDEPMKGSVSLCVCLSLSLCVSVSLSVNNKEFAMKISQTRLDERTRRLCVEVCFDEPMKGSVSLSVCLSVCLSVSLSLCLSVCLSVC